MNRHYMDSTASTDSLGSLGFRGENPETQNEMSVTLPGFPGDSAHVVEFAETRASVGRAWPPEGLVYGIATLEPARNKENT